MLYFLKNNCYVYVIHGRRHLVEFIFEQNLPFHACHDGENECNINMPKYQIETDIFNDFTKKKKSIQILI